MSSLSEKFAYLLDSLLRYREPVLCPSCGSRSGRQIDRKYVVTRLFECQDCGLYYRHPLERTEESREFYQGAYAEGDRLTTHLPSEEELQELKSKAFQTSSDRSAERLLAIFEACVGDVRGKKILDYGSSWGYISYQFKEAGMEVQSFEISVPRAAFGNEKLGLDIKSQESELKGGNDIFFSSHVIEHVPSAGDMLRKGASLLNEAGYIVAICPNGGPEFQAKYPANFHQLWGKVHPNILNARFYQRAFKDNPCYISTVPFDTADIAAWDKQSQVVRNLSGWELLLIARPNVRLSGAGQ